MENLSGMAELETTLTGVSDAVPTTVSTLTAREKRDQQKSQLRPLASRRPELYDEDEYSSEEYERMLDMYNTTMASIEEGEIVKSKVLEIRENMVVLDIGFKSEGTIPLEEFKDMPDLKPGDEVEVLLEHLEDQEGSVVLSKKKADFMRVWERIRLAYENDQPVEGTLVKKIKGGVVVDLMGVDAFLPGSQIALRRVPNIDELLGQKFEVKNITDFGAFIDLGGVDGLLHITDMSWGRVSHPTEMVAIGQELEVKVLDIDWTRERISLGLKQLHPYPWKDVADKYPVGTRVTGKVVSITNYGAFIELEPGIEGLVHISEMSWTRNVRHPSKLVSIGETIEAVVLKVDPSEEKISLGMKQTEQDPWMVLPLKYPAGTRINGKVRNLTSFGAFVEIEPGIDGLIHISDMSWTKRVQHPSEVVKKGDAVDVVILNIDSENKRISLGLKQAEEDPWLRIGETYPVGTEMRSKVVRLMDKGVVVDIGNDIEGFVPISQLGQGAAVNSPADVVYEGMNLDTRVLEVDPIHRRIVLSVVNIPEEQPPRPETPSKIHTDDGDTIEIPVDLTTTDE